MLLESFTSISQSHEQETIHDFKHFRGSFAIGQTYIPEASFGNAKFVVVPVLALDLQYWITPKWGVGLKNDIEIANYLVEGSNNGSEIIRENPIIISTPLFFSPWENHFTFIMGPGIELEQHANFYIFRAGIGSEFDVGNHWDFAPEIIYDLKDGHINTLTIAIAVGKSF